MGSWIKVRSDGIILRFASVLHGLADSGITMERKFEGTDSGNRVVTNSGAGVGTVVSVERNQAAVLLDAEVDTAAVSTVTIERNVVVHTTNEVVRLEESATVRSELSQNRSSTWHSGYHQRISGCLLVGMVMTETVDQTVE